MKLQEPEGQTLEYKQEWCDTARKTLIAFANGLGGVLQIGVADDGEIVGCDFDQVERAVQRFARDGAEPSIHNLVDIRKQILDGKVFASVLVRPGIRRPYALRGKVLTQGGVFIRLGGQTVPATLEEVIQLIQRGDPRTWESRPCNELDLTFEQAIQVFNEKQISFGESTWLGYGLLNREHELTNLALLLSDQNPYRVVVNTFDISGKVESSQRVNGSVLWQWNKVRERFSEVNTPIIDKESKDFSRKEVYPWPPLALREALTNTLAHRDYSSPLQVSVNIHPDLITFFTPGGIPPELTLEEAMKEGASFCRNDKLAEIFMRLHWMEKAGTGFGDIFRAYAQYPQKPKLQHIARSFQIELPRINEEQSSRETDVILFIKQSPSGRTRSEIEAYINQSRPTVLKLLKELRANGRVIVEGKGPSTRYVVPIK